jgi:hypothetical protein
VLRSWGWGWGSRGFTIPPARDPDGGGGFERFVEPGYVHVATPWNVQTVCDYCLYQIATKVPGFTANLILPAKLKPFVDVVVALNDSLKELNESKDIHEQAFTDVKGLFKSLGAGIQLADLLDVEVPEKLRLTSHVVNRALKTISIIKDILEIAAACNDQIGQAVRNVLKMLDEYRNRLQAIVEPPVTLYGNAAWLETTQPDVLKAWTSAFLVTTEPGSEAGGKVSDSERAWLLSLPLPDTVTPAMANEFIDRWNRTQDYWARQIYRTANVPPGQSTDFLDLGVLKNELQAAKNAADRNITEGIDDLGQAIGNEFLKLRQLLSGESGICATVRIRIDQQVVMTRAAFKGSLEIDNGSHAGPLSGVRVILNITDENGRPANGKFAIRTPELKGLTGVDGTGIVAPGGSGSALYTIIPNREAAPDAPTVYNIGGTLRYIDPETGREVITPLLATSITVYPDPHLKLNYFLQRDVIGQDPFSTDVTPPEPFALGLLVTNTGHGTAKNFTVTSAQPRIVDNQKGLLIDFRIISSQVGNQRVTPSLTVNLGDIGPGKTQVAQWFLTSTLQGRFTNYAASFEHVDGLGDQRLSLIDSVQIHELIHVARAGTDNLPAFLVDDNTNPEVLPDTLYFSDGTIAVVNIATNAATDGVVSLQSRVVHLTARMTSGWDYIRLPDPGAGYRLVRVVRSDGKELRVGDNVWQTTRVFAEGDLSYRREPRLHLLDLDGTGSYTLYYEVNDPVPPRVVGIVAVTPDPRDTPVASVDVNLSKEIDLATFDYHALKLTLNRGPNLITPAVTITQVSGSTYRINGLSGLTAADGAYELTVDGSMIRDYSGHQGSGSAVTTWSKGVAPPYVKNLLDITPNLRNTPVATVDVVFSKEIDLTTFTTSSLTLTRNGTSVSLPGSITFTQVSGTTYRIGGLAAVTGADGAYELTVNAASIRDLAGRNGVGSRSVDWTMDTVAPVLLSIETVATNPRNIVVLSLDVTFSKPIDLSTFDRSKITLTRNGGPNLIDDRVTVEYVSGAIYRIKGFSFVVGLDGTYVLTVNAAGIRDLAGNTATGLVSTSWVMKTTRPAAPTNLAITPSRGTLQGAVLTNTRSVTFTGSLAESGLTVQVFDVTTGIDLGVAAVTGTSFSEAITLASAGAHRLRAQAVDGAGNVSADSFLDIYIDEQQPTIIQVTDVQPNPRGTPVETIDVVLSKPVNLATFDYHRLTLTRDGGSNLITSAVTVALVNGTTATYRISGLGALTSVAGTYTLTIDASGLQDQAGNAGIGSASVSWLNILATHLRFRQQPVYGLVGQPLSPAVVVEITDDQGNVVAGANPDVTLTLGTNPGGSRLSGTLTVAAVNGVATFSNLILDTPGDGYTLVASSGTLLGATSNGFTVAVTNPGPTLAPIGNQTALVGQLLTFTASATHPNPNAILTFSLDAGAPVGAAIDPTTGVFQWTPSRAGSYTVTVRVTDNGNPAKSAFETIQIAVTPSVESVLINDGEAQRSMVTHLTVQFSDVMTFDPGAFVLTKADGSTVNVNVSTSVVNGKTVAVLTLTGDDIIGGSLADGRYSLTIVASKVHDSQGRTLVKDRVENFFRLFGDTQGRGLVDNLDLAIFRNAFHKKRGEDGYLWYLDYYNRGIIDDDSAARFLENYGHHI